MHEKHGIACDMMHGFKWGKWTTGTPTERLQLIPAGQEHILEQDDGKKRWVQVVSELSQAFALCSATDEATAIRDDVSFFQAIQAALNKKSGERKKSPEQIDAAIRQLVSKVIPTKGETIDLCSPPLVFSAPREWDMPAQGNVLSMRHHFIKP
jgi:type I restriction enzyme R subunit